MAITHRAPLRGAEGSEGTLVCEEIKVGDEVWVRTDGTAEEWNLGVIVKVRSNGIHRIRVKCNNSNINRTRPAIRTKSEHKLLTSKDSVVPGDNREFVEGEGVLAELNGKFRSKVECTFVSHSPNGQLITVMRKDGKMATLPASRVWKGPARTAPPSEEVVPVVKDNIKEMALADYADKMIAIGGGILSEEEMDIISSISRLCNSDKTPEPEEEEPVHIYRDIDWSHPQEPKCKAPSGKILSITAYPLFHTDRGYVFTGYLFRHNPPHILKDHITASPLKFDEDGRVSYCADSAVFVKLGEVSNGSD